MAYLTRGQAETRLSDSFDIEHEPTDAHLRIASARVDSLGPFIGIRYEDDQPLAFPRSVTLDGDTEGEVPEAVLDLVALFAYRLTDIKETPPVTSMSIGDFSESYATPRLKAADSLIKGALAGLIPYQRKTGTIR